jgi:hypothetical protein
VKFISRFSGANTTNNMLDNGIAPDLLAGDKIYTAQLGPFALAGTLTYYLQATDNTGKPTFEPWGGAADTNRLTIGSAIPRPRHHRTQLQSARTDRQRTARQHQRRRLRVHRVSKPRQHDHQPDRREIHRGHHLHVPRHKRSPPARAWSSAKILPLSPRATAAASMSRHDVRRPTQQWRRGIAPHRFQQRDDPALHLPRHLHWPGRADGNGSSLELIDPNGDYSDGANWRNSISYGGSPGDCGTRPSSRHRHQ